MDTEREKLSSICALTRQDSKDIEGGMREGHLIEKANTPVTVNLFQITVSRRLNLTNESLAPRCIKYGHLVMI